MNKFPYPVLCDENSSYRENICFDITYIRSTFHNDRMIFEFDIFLNSKYLRNLLADGKAKMYMKIQSNLYAFVSVIEEDYERHYVEVEVDKIQSNDILKINALIVAEEKIELVYDEEMLEIYNGDYSITVGNKDILGISNIESLSYNSSNNDFIKFSVSEEQTGKGYCVIINDNFINVLVGPEFNVAYGTVKNNKKEVCSIFDSHLVFEVFLYILIEVVQNYEECKENTWFILFEQIFLQCSDYKNFDEFILDALDDDKIDMNQIFYMAQVMVNNQIENSLITISRCEEA